MSTSSVCIEVFLLTRNSTAAELEQCIQHLKKNFEEKTFKTMQLVTKREGNTNSSFSGATRIGSQGNESIDNRFKTKTRPNTAHNGDDSIVNKSALGHSQNMIMLDRLNTLDRSARFEDGRGLHDTINLNKSYEINALQGITNQSAHKTGTGAQDETPGSQQRKPLAVVQEGTKNQAAGNTVHSFNDGTGEGGADRASAENGGRHQRGGDAPEKAARAKGGAESENESEEAKNDRKHNLSEKDAIIEVYEKAMENYKQKKFDTALFSFKNCVKQIMQSTYNTQLKSYEIGCNQYIGSCLMHQKMTTQAIESLDNALKIINDAKESTHHPYKEDAAQMYFIYNTMAYCYNDKKNYVHMIDAWEKAKLYLEQMSDPDQQKNMGHLLNNLGMAYFGNNNLKLAQVNFEKSVDIYKQIYGDEDISVGNRLNNLAEAYRNEKMYDQAIEYFEKSLAIKRKHFKNDNDKSIANTLNNIGMTYQNLKQLSDAVNYFKQSIDIYRNLYGETFEGDQASTIANVLNCLGDCYKGLGKPDMACKYFQDAYDIKKRIYGPDHKNTMHTSVLYAQMLFMTKKYEQSVDLFKELLEGQKKLYGADSLQVGQTLNNLGTVLNALKNYDEAIQHLTRAVEIFQKSGSIPQASIDKIVAYIDSIKKKIGSAQNQ